MGIPVGAVMQIVIPTRGRIYKQITLQSLPRELRRRTTIVCPEEEAVPLACYWTDVDGIVVEPYPNMKIAQTREWIVQEWLKAEYDKVIMLDDDLTFATRISADDTGLRQIRGDELIPEFQRIEDKLGPAHPHVGFGPRQGNHLESGGWKSPGKMVYSLGYYLPIVAKECRWDLVELREDYCVTLQLLLNGYPNAIWTGTVVDQKTNARGGCSIYRTVEMSDSEAAKLAELFPGYVSVVDREYETSLHRKETIVQWQKALEDGRRKRLFVC
jgi:hypothetical protein